MAGNQPLIRVCPRCCEPYRRYAEHVAKCCKAWTDEERIKAIDEEHERGRHLCTVAYDIDKLKMEFPQSYLDISSVLIRTKIPVYKVVKKRTHDDRFRFVKKYELDDIWSLRQTVLPSTSSGMVHNVENTTRQMVTDPIVDDDEEDEEDIEQPNPAVAISKLIASKAALGGKGKGKGKKTLTPKVIAEVEAEKDMSDNDGIHEDSDHDEIRVVPGRKRTRVVTSDIEEYDNAEKSEPPRKKTKTTKSKQESNDVLVKYNMYVPPDVAKELINNNKYVKKIGVVMRAKTSKASQKKTEDEQSRKVHIDNTLRNVIRVMKFISPNNEIESFSYECLANSDKLTEFFDVLKNIMLPNTVSNYHKALDYLFAIAIEDPQFRIKQGETHAHVESVKMSIERIKKGTHKDKSQRQTEKKLRDTYTDIKEIELSFLNIFRNMERVRKVAVPLIMKAKEKKVDLSDGDLFIVNGFFNIFSTVSLGNRPAVFQNMRLEIFELADKCRQVRADGSAFYFLATADHKTGSNELAYIYVEEEDWELFRIYRNHIRRTPVAADKDMLFLNSNGKRIYNPSADIKTMLERYGAEIMTCGDSRKYITTMASHHCSKEDQDIIHKMLTHTPATADKHYLESTSMAIPHRRGIPLLEQMQREISRKHDVSVSSFLKKSVDLETSSTRQPEQPPERAATPLSDSGESSTGESSSSEGETTTKSNMKILLSREFSSIGPFDTLPGREDYRVAAAKHRDLNLPTDSKTCDNFVAICSYEQAKGRAQECADFYRRTKITNEHDAATAYIKKMGWKMDSKTLRVCKSELKKMKKTQGSSKRNTEKKDDPIITQIEKQEWPDLMIRRCGGDKGTGIFASKVISKGTVVCDYHGERLDDEEGRRRYDAYGDKKENTYMFQFDIGGETHWVDGVVQCECHPTKKIKGRLINHSREHPNVIPKARFLNGNPHLLLVAKREINKSEEILFDYGSYKDPLSSQMEWM